jgi:AcrR family transcriptional regulator
MMRIRSGEVRMDDDLQQATITVLRERGWDGLTLERVAEVAGRSRSTLWRQGVTRESLIAGLVGELATDFQAAMYPVLTSAGTGRERLIRAMDALCDVLDRHLPLMLATDEAFHQPPVPGQPPAYLGPFIQFLREGAADGSLAPGDEAVETADVLMNALLWTYVHLRGRHGWTTDRTRAALFELVLHGVATDPQRKE